MVEKLKLSTESEVKLDSLGLEIKESTYDVSRKSSFKRFKMFVQENPALMLAIGFIAVLFIYMLWIFDELTAFHNLAMIISSFFMIWISLVEDARVLYKFGSITSIFIGMLLFLVL